MAIVGTGCTVLGAVSSWMFQRIDPQGAIPYVVIALLFASTLARFAGLAAAAAVPGGPRPTGELAY